MTRSVRIGVAGLGKFGEVHIRAIRRIPEFELVSVCSRSEERARQIAETYGIDRWYTDLRSFAADPDIEAVDVVNEVSRHAEAAGIALDAGKDVLVEKPLSARMDEVDAVLRLAERNERILMVGYIERYDPRRAAMREQIASGELGDVVSLYGRRNCGRHFLSLPRFQVWPLIVEPGIHTVDMLLWFAESRVERVSAVGRCHNEWDTIDTWWAMLEFSSGAVGTIEQVWHIPEGAPASWLHDNCLEVIGTKGSVQMRDPHDAFWSWTLDGTCSNDYYLDVEVAGQAAGALANELRYFARCVSNRQQPALGSPAEIRHATEVALAIVSSAGNGCPVDLNRSEMQGQRG